MESITNDSLDEEVDDYLKSCKL